MCFSRPTKSIRCDRSLYPSGQAVSIQCTRNSAGVGLVDHRKLLLGKESICLKKDIVLFNDFFFGLKKDNYIFIQDTICWHTSGSTWFLQCHKSLIYNLQFSLE